LALSKFWPITNESSLPSIHSFDGRINYPPFFLGHSGKKAKGTGENEMMSGGLQRKSKEEKGKGQMMRRKGPLRQQSSFPSSSLPTSLHFASSSDRPMTPPKQSSSSHYSIPFYRSPPVATTTNHLHSPRILSFFSFAPFHSHSPSLRAVISNNNGAFPPPKQQIVVFPFLLPFFFVRIPQ
jgi:hypothetical protein